MPPPTLPNGLTPKQEAFCHAYIKLGDSTKAYREVYAPKTTKDATVWRAAKRVMDTSKVRTRIAELRAPAAEACMLDLKTHLEKLAELRDKAMKDSNWSAAIQAEQSRGKAAGLYVDKKKIDGNMNTNHIFTCVID